ncbi:MAG: hypothetical protein QOK48_1077 [Blastocatellia bacterium]|jgi:hypothetical protein|nr:hypothetical protein [Blastocatellia bacterium]
MLQTIESGRAGDNGLGLSLGEIVASRSYRLVDEDNNERAVSVLVGKPQRARDANEYQCPFQLIGIGNQIIQSARGHDSIQALQAAFILISASINHLSNEFGRELIWDGGRKGELGFP